MVRKFFIKQNLTVRRLLRSDLLGLKYPYHPVQISLSSVSGLFVCSLFTTKGDVHLQASSLDKLMSLVRDCYRDSFLFKLDNFDVNLIHFSINI